MEFKDDRKMQKCKRHVERSRDISLLIDNQEISPLRFASVEMTEKDVFLKKRETCSLQKLSILNGRLNSTIYLPCKNSEQNFMQRKPPPLKK
jgi:hypothetical protein